MSPNPNSTNVSKLAFGLMAGVAVVSLVVAGYSLGKYDRLADLATSPRADSGLPIPLLEATGTVSSDDYSLTTGSVSEDADGVFVLDHNSGLMQCSVIYPRLGRFLAQFTVNVKDALGRGSKGGQYMMVTGRAEFPRSSSRPIAPIVVYVLDTATGNFACYGIPFDRTAVSAGRPQNTSMVLLTQGTANPLVDRENLR